VAVASAAGGAMIREIDTRDPIAVGNEVGAIHATLFPDGERAFVPRAFDWAVQCFRGAHGDYLPIDVGYHDLEHTLQGVLCLTRLLRGRHRAGASPRLTVEAFELGVLAILFGLAAAYFVKQYFAEQPAAAHEHKRLRISADSRRRLRLIAQDGESGQVGNAERGKPAKPLPNEREKPPIQPLDRL